MNAKHLFLTLTMLLASITFAWAGDFTDVISYTGINAVYGAGVDPEDDEGYNDFADFNKITAPSYVESAANYTGQLYYDTGKEVLGLYNDLAYSATASGGTIQTITIHWSTQTALGKSIQIFLGTEDYAGGDDPSSASAKSKKTVSKPYPGSATTTVVDVAALGVFTNVAFFGDDEVFFTAIDIDWHTEDVTKYDIAEGTKLGKGTISISPTSAAAGDLVTVQFTPNAKNKFSLTQFGYDGMTFDLACVGYFDYNEGTGVYTHQFIMPARNVTIDATFEKVSRSSNAITVTEGTEIEIQSGVETTIHFTLSHEIDGKIWFEISDRSYVNVVDSTFDGTNGSATIIGLAPKTTTPLPTIIVHSSKTIAYTIGTSLGVEVTITPREVVLLAERGGSYYVMENSLAGSMASAHEVVFNTKDSKYYYDEGLNLSDVTWNAATVATGEYTIQKPSNDNYLKFDKGNLELNASSYSWWKNGEGKFMSPSGSYGISYNGSKFLAAADLTNAAVEALIGDNFIPFGSYSTVSGAVINDSRSLTEGNYGTFCSPYDVPSSSVAAAGAKFYTLEGKVVDGETLAGIVISKDPVTELEAGHSYIYQVDAGSSAINLSGCTNLTTEAWKNDNDGFVGCLTGDGSGAGQIYAEDGVAPRSEGCYILKNNQLRYVASGAKARVTAYRAYIHVGELDVIPPASIPKRRIVLAEGFTGEVGMEDTATGIDELTENTVINWNEPVYNIMGMRVGKGATGVLIQNGHKFFVK